MIKNKLFNNNRMISDLELATNAAIKAGDIILNYFKSDYEIKEKSYHNPVTTADKAADDFLKSTLMKNRPKYGWLSEETVDLKQMDLSRRALQVCYELLPKHMKAMAKLRFQEEKSLLQISKVLKRPMGSVSATLHRIRINLIACVKEKIPSIEADLDS